MAAKPISKEELQMLLNSCPSLKADLALVITSLRRRQLSGAHQCAKATIELLRSLVSRVNFSCADHMMRAVRAVGCELMAAAQSELTIGNLVRRVLFLVREEYASQIKEHENMAIVEELSIPTKLTRQERRDRGYSDLSVCSQKSGHSGNQSTIPPIQATQSATTESTNDLSKNSSTNISTVKVAGSGNGNGTISPTPQLSLDNMLSQLDLTQSTDTTQGSGFDRYFPGLKAGIIGAINELNNEIDNTTAICQRAQDYIHADEVILTYGYSRIVEQFLRSAGAKRKFQVIIAESNPGLDGHRLAQSLYKVPGVSVTLIPDSNIYAIMARVNKVILSPQAVMADGGAICRSGQLMVSVAAKDFSVPVVGVAGAFTLTPLFAHNQTTVLNQLLSPAAALPYHANINVDNVEVNYPAFDYLPPDLITLYITNDGSQLPSYVFRQLSEYYHPNDYNIN